MTQLSRDQQAAALEKDWAENPRWKGIKRPYSAADVVRLRGSLGIEHTGHFAKYSDHTDLAVPTRLILPSIQVNMRAGHLPPADDNGVTYLKIPVNAV